MLKNNHVPFYLQIAQNIRDKIISGEYPVNFKLPSEDEIVKIFGVSRMTARHAVTQLVNEGLVYRMHGKGAFVARSKVERNLNKLNGFYEDMKELGMNPSSKILQFTKRLPDQREQHLLQIHKNQEVYYVYRSRYVDDNPIGLQSLVVPVRLVPDLDQVDLEVTSFYSYLDQIGSPLVKADQRMEAILAPNVAKKLGVSEKLPFFFFERISYNEEDNPVELLNSYFRGDFYSYNITLYR
ncbi:GntR family transcriptional regulator [Paenibacillus sp. J2TS4]|uniref:GntR family transcriptional regulator n=1 Tax=Paenibacillus sp. J2TS4 TaxID=2807194 RepID=UPI001B1A0951|nr:GntR family transcriptional regulator [Paenibacillus sp. J2TS4]GIP31620.1 phosphonate metabolism transcriptional regulator PhnF [Paenibacillus sp. J2TS4]